MNTDRLNTQSITIDRLRPLLALMVVGLHVRPYYTTGTETFFDGVYEASVITVFRILFSVAVPFFFLISGFYFFKGLNEWDTSLWKAKIKKRTGSLLIPYIIWNIIALIGYPLTRLAGCWVKGAPFPDILAQLNERGWLRLFWNRSLYGEVNEGTTNLLGWIVDTGAPMNAPTWFLRDLMVVILFTPLIWWLIRHLGKGFILITGLLYLVDIWIPVSGFSSSAFLLFSIGAWLSLTGKDLVWLSQKKPLLQASIALTLMFVAAITLGRYQWIYNVSSRLFIIFAIPVLFHLTSEMPIRKGLKKITADMSRSSFFVYVVHMVLITDAINWVLLYFIHPQNKAALFILLTISTITVYLVCHLIWLFMSRYMPKTLNILTGNRSVDRLK